MKKLISLLIRFVPRPLLQRLSGTGLKVAGWWLRGDGSECLICSRQYRNFLPYGRLRARENALCPGCLSLERHRLIWYYLKDQTDFFSGGKSVLHIAPENCFLKPFERLHGKGYITADLESPLATVRMDIMAMPFSEATFDIVLCSHVLEHVTDDIVAMQEIHRVLKPGGWALLQVPFFAPIPDQTIEDASITGNAAREKMFGQADHLRRYGKDFSQRISRSGLSVKEEDFAFKLSPEVCRRYGLVPETLFIGIRRD
ncbi:MAG: class I SAM-dependent methyltransferase [Bacteroidota bacterium]